MTGDILAHMAGLRVRIWVQEFTLNDDGQREKDLTCCQYELDYITWFS